MNGTVEVESVVHLVVYSALSRLEVDLVEFGSKREFSKNALRVRPWRMSSSVPPKKLPLSNFNLHDLDSETIIPGSYRYQMTNGKSKCYSAPLETKETGKSGSIRSWNRRHI